MRLIRRGAAIAALLGAATLAPTAWAEPVLATQLDISASGDIRVAPEKAEITLGVQSRAPTAARAMRDNAERMTQVGAALTGLGVASADVQTSSLNLQADYEYPQGQPPRLTGYQAANDVVVTVRDLPKLGAALDALVAAGVNQINGIGFGLKDPLAAQNAARRAAVTALRDKADLYAQATGYRTARLVRLTEDGGRSPGPIQPMFAKALAAPATPVSPGELSVRVDVTGVFELTR